MAHLTDLQKSRANAFQQSRNGIRFPVTPPNVLNNACWAWALLGTRDTSTLPTQLGALVDQIFQQQFVFGQDGNVTVNVNGINDIRAQIPGSGAYFNQLIAAYNVAANRRNFDQNPISIALMKILAVFCGLTPSNHPRPDYYLYMNATNWHAWDHWGIGIRYGNLSSIVQTVTGVPLAHSCNVLWDEHLPVKCRIGLQQLHQSQVNVINTIPAPNANQARCIVCGAVHGRFASRVRKWHRCGTCSANYCYFHGWRLAAAHWYGGQRTCGVTGCNGQTVQY